MRRALTREQAQARTRELVLGAAEELFLTKGLHATTVAEIAATAGRTQGSIYGNFTNKEALCLAVLERRYEQIFAELEGKLANASDALDDKLETVAQWWRTYAANDALTLLVAEFAAAARRDANQFAAVTAAFTGVQNTFGSIFATHFESRDARVNSPLDVATLGVVSTVTGLAVGQAVSTIDPDMSAAVLAETVRLWTERLEARKSAT